MLPSRLIEIDHADGRFGCGFLAQTDRGQNDTTLYDVQGCGGSMRGIRTPDTRIMIPLL